MKTKSLNLLLLTIVTCLIIFSCKKTQEEVVNSKEEVIPETNSGFRSNPNELFFPEVPIEVGKTYEYLTRSIIPSEKGIFDRATKMTLFLDANGTLNVDRKEIVVGEAAAGALPQVHFLTETTLKRLGNGSQKVDHALSHPQRDDIAYIPFSMDENQPVFMRKSGELRAVCECINFNIPPGQAGGDCVGEGVFCVQTCYNCKVTFTKVHQTLVGRSVVVYTGPGSSIKNISIKS